MGVMKKPRMFELIVLYGLWVSSFSTMAQAAAPVPSLNTLTTGNGHGFAVFDINQKKINQFLERPYRYVRPGATQMDVGVERRNLIYDLYFGVRAGATATWMKDTPQTQVGYVAESNIMRAVGVVNGVTVESYFFAPYGYAGNAV